MMFPLNHGVIAAGNAISNFGFDSNLTFPAEAAFTLTNDNKSASLDALVSPSWEYIGVAPPRSSGKCYLEIVINPYTDGTSGVVFALPGFSGGPDFESVDAVSFRSSQIYAYGVYRGTNGIATAGSGDAFGVAFDFDNLTATYYLNGVASTNVVSITTGSYTPFYSARGEIGQNCTIRGTASEIQYLPSGFTAWAEAES